MMTTIKATIKNVLTILNVMEFVDAITNTITLKNDLRFTIDKNVLAIF
jgi:hypothetical protein